MYPDCHTTSGPNKVTKMIQHRTEYSLLVVIKSKVQEAQTKSQSLSVFFLLFKKMCVNRTKLGKVGVNYLCESIQYLSTEVLRVRLT